MPLCGSLNILWHSSSLRLKWKTDLFQSCGHCWVFQISWYNECITLTGSSSSIWNSSAGILSPPLALFIVMLPNAHLTSHSRMSGSRWAITPSWLSRSLRPFLHSSSVYSCHLFLISSESVRSFLTISVFYHAHPGMKYFLDISNFLEVVSSLSHSIVFPPLLAVLTKNAFFKKNLSLLLSGTLHSAGCIFPFSLAFHFSSCLSYL